MPERELKVWGDSGTFTIKVPEDAKVTFGPWAPPNARMIEGSTATSGARFGPERGGKLRIYKGTKTTGDILAVFAGVQGFRDTAIEYTEEPSRMPEPEAREVVDWSDMEEDEKDDLAARIARVFADKAMEEKDEDTEPVPF